MNSTINSGTALDWLTTLADSIEAILQQTRGPGRLADVDCQIAYRDTPEEALLREQIGKILCLLDGADTAIRYLGCGVRADGVLRRGPNGRYSFPGGPELTCGAKIELLIPAGYAAGRDRWTLAQIGRDGHGYYAVGYREVPLEGLKARVRHPRRG